MREQTVLLYKTGPRRALAFARTASTAVVLGGRVKNGALGRDLTSVEALDDGEGRVLPGRGGEQR